MGTFELSDSDMEFLSSPLADDEIEIRPDGIVYACWITVASRFNKVFKGAWGLRPVGKIEIKDNYAIGTYDFFVRGNYIRRIISGAEMSNYKSQRWDDLCESVYSNTITRAGKHFCIGNELYSEQVREEWKARNAEEYTVTSKDGRKFKRWRKKGGKVEQQQQQQKNDYQPPPQAPPQQKQQQQKTVLAEQHPEIEKLRGELRGLVSEEIFLERLHADQEKVKIDGYSDHKHRVNTWRKWIREGQAEKATDAEVEEDIFSDN